MIGIKTKQRVLDKLINEPEHYGLMLPELHRSQRASDSYAEMYKRIGSDCNTDLEMIFKYLSKVSTKIDWNDDDVFNVVLTMRDDAVKASKRVQIPKDDPKWDRIAKMLERAAVRGKSTGIFKVEEPDFVPFWKKPLEVGGETYKIDLNLIYEL